MRKLSEVRRVFFEFGRLFFRSTYEVFMRVRGQLVVTEIIWKEIMRTTCPKWESLSVDANFSSLFTSPNHARSRLSPTPNHPQRDRSSVLLRGATASAKLQPADKWYHNSHVSLVSTLCISHRSFAQVLHSAREFASQTTCRASTVSLTTTALAMRRTSSKTFSSKS